MACLKCKIDIDHSLKQCAEGGFKNGVCCKYGINCVKGCENGGLCQRWCKFNMGCSRVDCKHLHSKDWNPIQNQKPCRF